MDTNARTSCRHCGSGNINKAGLTKNKKQRFYCRFCRRFSRENAEIVDPRLIADVAAVKSISRIGLPRRLEAEILTSAKTVGAPVYREKFSVTGKGIIVAVLVSEVAIQHPA